MGFCPAPADCPFNIHFVRGLPCQLTLRNHASLRVGITDDNNRRNVGVGAEAELSKVPDYKFLIFMIVSVASVLHLHCLHPVKDTSRFITHKLLRPTL